MRGEIIWKIKWAVDNHGNARGGVQLEILHRDTSNLSPIDLLSSHGLDSWWVAKRKQEVRGNEAGREIGCEGNKTFVIVEPPGTTLPVGNKFTLEGTTGTMPAVFEIKRLGVPTVLVTLET